MVKELPRFNDIGKLTYKLLEKTGKHILRAISLYLSLSENYFDNFKEETEHGPESIFAVEYDESMPNGAFWNSDVNGEGGNESSLRGQSYGMFDWFNAYPSDELRAEFEENDPRFDESFYTVGDTYAGGVITEISLDRPAGWRKYQNYYFFKWP